MPSSRLNISSGTQWEPIVGYSRAVRVGNTVYVAGTTALNDNGEVVGLGDAYAQTIRVLKNIETALAKAGAVNIDDWMEIGRAHGEVFSEIRPATTIVEVKRLIDSDLLVEIEAEAVME
jgi:enamine deaminase RidA (YjgF/YER057c/UK114 family)